MLINTFADYVARSRAEPLPEAVAHAAARCIVDWFAATIPGGIVQPATLLAMALVEDLAHGAAMLVPSRQPTTMRTAALINGVAAHTLEFDDIYRDGLYHPGAPVIAAALATAQGRGTSGAELLRAVVAGYEVSTRIAVAVTPSHYEYWHTTGTVGTLGAAAAAACALGLDRTRTADALGHATTMAAGLQQAFRSSAMTKPLHAGHAAEAGVLAALAAETGVRGAHDMLEGERGFGAAMSRHPDWGAATADLDRGYNILRITPKNHGACGHAFAAIDAALALRREHGIVPAQVAAVRVKTYAKAIEVAGLGEPADALEARFSLPYCVSAALHLGSVRLGAFDNEHLQDAALRGLAARVALEVDPELDAAYPMQRAATVTLSLRDGRVLEHHRPTRKGDPDDPLTDAELEEKFLELATPVLGAHGAQALLEGLWRLPQVDNVNDVLRGEDA